ncbi:DEAD/DEAH-box helicase [Rhizoctonia solani 123E]|uniref:DNA 3'-5' helicase n=1 Tax=Rhizoctonia solani 123E TaxID=1423351 RepID=A0A074RUS4_9AGAM|nr:DEAD/DEAH-box helicase [Rhizoctonia solani 123E]
MPSHAIRSQGWYEETLCQEMHYSELKDWQKEGVMALCGGKDVFLVIGTGQGKSFLIQAPIIADRKSGNPSIGIVLVPTKALADDQARAAKDKGINALALHEDSRRAAQKETTPRDLFKETAAGHWELIFLSPEMLTTKPFNKLINDSAFIKRLRYFTIDECHLTCEWRHFRAAYGHIVRLRNRFPADSVIWLALSATVSKRTLPLLVKELGFSSDRRRCLIKQLPVDRPKITYSSRLIKHATSRNKFLDFAFLASPKPQGPRTAKAFPITIIFAARIEYGNHLMSYLTNLLPDFLRGKARTELILPYNSIMSAAHRLKAAQALRDGSTTRMLMCSASGAFGLDIAEVERVVVIVNGPDETYETLCQKHGRIRGTGVAITYLPVGLNRSKNRKTDQHLRERAPPVMVEYANATSENCPRQINCRYWGEAFVLPLGVACCNLHDPDIDQEDQRITDEYVKLERSTATTTRGIRGDGTHHPLAPKTLQPAVYKLLKHWRDSVWFSYPYKTANCPSTMLVTDHLLRSLCKWIHACTTYQTFRRVMADWERMEEFGPRLYAFCQKVLPVADTLWTPPLRRKRKIEEEGGK